MSAQNDGDRLQLLNLHSCICHWSDGLQSFSQIFGKANWREKHELEENCAGHTHKNILLSDHFRVTF